MIIDVLEEFWRIRPPGPRKGVKNPLHLDLERGDVRHWRKVCVSAVTCGEIRRFLARNWAAGIGCRVSTSLAVRIYKHYTDTLIAFCSCHAWVIRAVRFGPRFGTSISRSARRRAAWQPPPPHYPRGYGALFTATITQADRGCDFEVLRGTDPVPEPEIG